LLKACPGPGKEMAAAAAAPNQGVIPVRTEQGPGQGEEGSHILVGAVELGSGPGLVTVVEHIPLGKLGLQDEFFQFHRLGSGQGQGEYGAVAEFLQVRGDLQPGVAAAQVREGHCLCPPCVAEAEAGFAKLHSLNLPSATSGTFRPVAAAGGATICS